MVEGDSERKFLTFGALSFTFIVEGRGAVMESITIYDKLTASMLMQNAL